MDSAGVDPDFELALQAVQRDINWYAPRNQQIIKLAVPISL